MIQIFVVTFLLTTSAFGAESFTRCSNADASVIYLQNQLNRQLFVSFQKIDRSGRSILVKKELTHFNIKEVSQIPLSSTCTENHVKDLVFRKIIISKTNGELLPENILGVSSDRSHIPVDYLCETTRVAPTICR